MKKSNNKSSKADIMIGELGRDMMVPELLFPRGTSERTSYLAGAAMSLFAVAERMKEQAGYLNSLSGLMFLSELTEQLNDLN